jgi:hypothetical protein
MSNTVTEVTRRRIIDYLSASRVNWSGRLGDDEFLARLYDLNAIPSTDSRFHSAAADIHQHTVNWTDWDQDWVFFDSRFNLFHVSDEHFLGFLCEMVHPVVRPDAVEASKLVEVFNTALSADGWALVGKDNISGRPVYQAMRPGTRREIIAEPTGWEKVDRQRQEARLRLDTAINEEQFQAVGLLCREVLISTAQEVFNHARHETPDKITPSPTDADRMLAAFFATELAGGANEEARSHAKAALKLAVALQHRRTADDRMAALCFEATMSVVNTVAILSGRRG